LQRIVRLQENGALFAVSVPNIANIWIRINLLAGRFDYTDNGILDRTHTRFFTRKTTVDMIKNTGLTIKKITATPIPIDLVSIFFRTTLLGKFIHWTLYLATKIYPTLFGYQFIVFAQKEE
jgi:hypothetical protein